MVDMKSQMELHEELEEAYLEEDKLHVEDDETNYAIERRKIEEKMWVSVDSLKKAVENLKNVEHKVSSTAKDEHIIHLWLSEIRDSLFGEATTEKKDNTRQQKGLSGNTTINGKKRILPAVAPANGDKTSVVAPKK